MKKKMVLLMAVFCFMSMSFCNNSEVYTNQKRDQGFETIFKVILAQKFEDAKELIRKTKNITQLRGKEGETVLHRAAENATPELITSIVKKRILNKRGLVNAIDANGETPLMYAVRTHNVATVKKLLDIGANKNIKDKRDQTDLDKAKELKNQVEVYGDFPPAVLSDFNIIISVLETKK